MAVFVHVHKPSQRARTLDMAREWRKAEIDALADRMAAALEELMGWARSQDRAWDESKHPRASDGRFGDRAGERGQADLGPKPTTARAKAAKAAIHELLSTGHAFTRAELMTATGMTSEKLFSDYIAMLKNPKYAGSAGALEIVREGEHFQVKKKMAVAPPAPPPPPKPAAPPVNIPPPTPAPTQAPVAVSPGSSIEIMEAKYVSLNEAAVVASAAAKRESTSRSHRLASTAHYEAQLHAEKTAEAMQQAGRTQYPGYRMAALHHRQAVSIHSQLVDQLTAMESARATIPAGNAARVAEIESRYLKSTPAEIHADMHGKFGLGVLPGNQVLLVRGARPVDLSKKSAAATAQRKMLGHVHEAMADLQRQGFDVKAALLAAPKPVFYSPASLSRSNGLAWQSPYSPRAHFAVSGTKRLNDNAEQYAMNAQRLAKGQPRWTVSSAALGPEAARATIVHELAHAVGMQPDSPTSGTGSPQRLSALLSEHMKTVSPDPGDRHEYGREHRKRVSWIKKNISEYAAANANEADAELAAMVTAPGYARGTLPPQFEAHVDRLFRRKAP